VRHPRYLIGMQYRILDLLGFRARAPPLCIAAV
jgi:hypothetical protein